MGKGGGGHGGLNILPQKSWNVYREDNKAKVRADEEKFEAEQRKLEDAAVQAQRDQRRKLLLQKARISDAVENETTDTVPETKEISEHIHLFKEEESVALEQERARILSNGKVTAEEKFENSFRLGGEVPKPWYAQTGTSFLVPTESDSLPSRIRKEKAGLEFVKEGERVLPKETIEFEQRRAQKRERESETRAQLEDSKPAKRDKKDKKDKKSKNNKHNKKHKDKDHKRSKHSEKGSGSGRVSVEQLRAERIRREAQERARQTTIVQTNILSTAQSHCSRGINSGLSQAKYHSGYGYASKTSR